jgi:hypothetical protein
MEQDLSKMTDEQLAAAAAQLADDRTKVRKAQNAVTAEQEMRKALAGMSGPAREVAKIRLEGKIDAEGGAKPQEDKQ